MPTTPTSAPTPEELAGTGRLSIERELGISLGYEAEDIITAAIRQHSAPLEAQIAELTAALSAEAIGLKAANTKIDRLRKAAEGTDQWANDVIAAICKHVGVDDADDGFTAADLASLLEEHNAEFDAISARATTAEAALAAMTAERGEAAQAHMRDLTVAADALTEARLALSASQERELVMREALSKPGLLVYLDGRDEDSAFVVPFEMRTADIDTERDLNESAEAIYDEAVKLGYGSGCLVWCEFSYFAGQYGEYGMCEIAPGHEFDGISPLMTEMFGGHPPAEDADLQPKEAGNVR